MRRFRIDTERLINQAERVGTTIVSAADAVRQGKQEYGALRKEDRQTNRIGESYQAMKRDADEQERTMREELSRRRTPRGGLSDARPDRRTP